MVGERGFEPPTPCSRSRCSTRLSHSPNRSCKLAAHPPAQAWLQSAGNKRLPKCTRNRAHFCVVPSSCRESVLHWDSSSNRNYHQSMTPRGQIEFTQFHVLDGGMASELEFLGADISGPLWSAHILEDAPEKVIAVHRAYLEAGADVLLTASYQVSRKGYAEFGLDPIRADQALLRSVELACQARAEFASRKILIAASLGPYGAALHNGA